MDEAAAGAAAPDDSQEQAMQPPAPQPSSFSSDESPVVAAAMPRAPPPPPPPDISPLPSEAEAPEDSLQVTLPKGNVTVVRTADELIQALGGNERDIEIQQHIDARDLLFKQHPQRRSSFCEKKYGVPGGGCDFTAYMSDTRSIRVRC